MDTWTVSQGIAATWRITIRDGDGDPITTYTGLEALAGTISPGRSVAPVATLAPTWADPSRGLVDVPVPAAATRTLAAGLYFVRVQCGDSSALFYEGLLEVDYAPGTDVVPAAYCTYEDMKDYCGFLAKLSTVETLTGFAKQRGRARSWLDDILLASFQYTNLGARPGQPGFMPGMMGGGDPGAPPNAWLRAQLDAGRLKITDQVREITAKKSIFYVCMPQLSRLEETEIKLARAMGRDADSLVRTLRAEIVLGANPVGPYDWASLVIFCGGGSLR